MTFLPYVDNVIDELVSPSVAPALQSYYLCMARQLILDELHGNSTSCAALASAAELNEAEQARSHAEWRVYATEMTKRRRRSIDSRWCNPFAHSRQPRDTTDDDEEDDDNNSGSDDDGNNNKDCSAGRERKRRGVSAAPHRALMTKPVPALFAPITVAALPSLRKKQATHDENDVQVSHDTHISEVHELGRGGALHRTGAKRAREEPKGSGSVVSDKNAKHLATPRQAIHSSDDKHSLDDDDDRVEAFYFESLLAQKIGLTVQLQQQQSLSSTSPLERALAIEADAFLQRMQQVQQRLYVSRVRAQRINAARYLEQCEFKATYAEMNTELAKSLAKVKALERILQT